MDLSGLFFGAGSKLAENQIQPRDGLPAQVEPDQLAGTKIGFWQFLQHFLRSDTAPQTEQSLEIANIGFAEIDINPTAVEVEEMVATAPQNENQPEPAMPDTVILQMENKVQFRDAFSKMREKQWLTQNELADLVSLAKNSAPNGVFSEKNLQELAVTLQAVLSEKRPDARSSETLSNTDQQERENTNLEIDTLLPDSAPTLPLEVLPENADGNFENLDAGGIPNVDTAGQISEDVVQQLVSVVSEDQTRLRPVVLASQTTDRSQHLWHLTPALSLQNSTEHYVVAIDNGDVADEFALTGGAVQPNHAQNFIKVVAPEETAAAQITFDSATENETPDILSSANLTSPNPSFAADASSDRTDESATDTNDQIEVPQQSDHLETRVDIAPSPADNLIPPVENQHPAPKRKTPEQKQTAKYLAGENKTPADSAQSHLQLDINELNVDQSLEKLQTRDQPLEKLQTRDQLDRAITDKLRVRILKISHEETENSEGQVIRKAQEIILPEERKAQLLKADGGLQKTASAWQQALSDKLQNQSQPVALRSGLIAEGDDSPGLRHHAMKSYAEHSREKKEGPSERHSASNLTESSARTELEIAAGSKEKSAIPSPHAAKILATKSKVMQQVDRVQTFENIRSQIAAKVRPGQTEIQMQLKPENLGSMRLLMSMKNGWLNVNFFVDSAEVKSLLDKNMPSLRETLADRGIKAEHVEVQVNQPVVQTQRSENQETRYSRGNQNGQRQKQDEQSQQRQRNRQENPDKKFDQYL